LMSTFTFKKTSPRLKKDLEHPKRMTYSFVWETSRKLLKANKKTEEHQIVMEDQTKIRKGWGASAALPLRRRPSKSRVSMPSLAV